MSKRPFEWKRDGGGLVLFVAGAFVSTLMVLALFANQPLDQITGSAAIAAPLVNAFGAWPCLVIAAGVGFLGGRSFITASEAGALRHALGLVGCAVGFSILLGAFSDTGGGRFGLLIGGGLGLMTHATLGGLLGLAVFLASSWYAWLREPGALYEEQIRSSVTDRAEIADPGVTAAEAAGLIPDDLPQVQPAGRKSTYVVLAGPPPSPYPEDVRLKGQVPAGARPISTSNAAPTYPAAPRVASERLAEPLVARTQPFHPGADLAAAASAAAPLAAPAARKVQPLPPGVQRLEREAEELTERGEDQTLVEAEVLESTPLRPTWEQTGLGEDDEPVDAYGTPLSLVESLRKAQEELVAIPESAPAEPAETVLAESDDEVEDDLDEDEVGDADEEADEDEDEDEEKEPDEEEVELFADDEEALVEQAPVALVVPQEIAAEEPAEEYVEIVEELVPASELEEPVAEVKALAQTTIFDFTGDAQAGVELFPEARSEAAPLEEPMTELVPDPVAEVQAEPEGEIEIEVGEEPEVILQPQAAPAERAHKSHSVDPQRAKLLAEAGCLFVERGRVAVSMLQRQYGMDFDDACKVLDELQDLGLIGPYLGGQTRDILLTRDQWLEKAGAI